MGRRKITQGQKMGVSRLASGRGVERGVQGNDYRSSDEDEGGQRAEPQRALALLTCAAARLGGDVVGLAGTYPPRDRVKGARGGMWVDVHLASLWVGEPGKEVGWAKNERCDRCDVTDRDVDERV
jgi:hypothetical protein